MKNKFVLLLRLIAAVILIQTLYFKFSGAPESVFIFSSLSAEPWGRWMSGVFELIASILLLIPTTQLLGAGMALGIMLGAILSHFFVLGIVVQGDGGLLFSLACIVLVASTLIIILRREQILPWIERLKRVYDGRK